MVDVDTTLVVVNHLQEIAMPTTIVPSHARAPLASAARHPHPRTLCCCVPHAVSSTPHSHALQQFKMSKVMQTGLAAAAALLVAVSGADARLEGVNKPELLPKEYTPVIDVAGFLTEGEVRA